jgi:hypothetical protein
VNYVQTACSTAVFVPHVSEKFDFAVEVVAGWPVTADETAPERLESHSLKYG